MGPETPSDPDILLAVFEADGQLFNRGESLKTREEKILSIVQGILGLGTTVARGPFSPIGEIDERILGLFRKLYGKDSSPRRVGHGVVEFRGVAYLVKVPIVLGTVSIEPFQHTMLTDIQVGMIKRSKDHFSNTIFQIGDAFDTLQGLDSKLRQPSVLKPNERSLSHRFYAESRKNFLSVCTLAAQSLDVCECVLSGFLAMELCVKGFLAERNWNAEELKKLGHKPKLFAEALKNISLPVDFERVDYVFNNAPNFVKVRYGDEVIKDNDALPFLIGVQFVLAELMRVSGPPSILTGIGEEFQRRWPPAAN